MEAIACKRKRAHLLLQNAHLVHAKDDILSGYGVTRLRDLSEPLLDDLIHKIEGLVERKHSDASKEVREWRHKCLRMIAKCGVDTQDWEAVNAFMHSPRICGKHLYELSIHELINLHRKLQNVAPNMAEQRERELNHAKQN